MMIRAMSVLRVAALGGLIACSASSGIGSRQRSRLPSLPPTPGGPGDLSLRLWTEATEYRPGELVRFGVQLMNVGPAPACVDGRLQSFAHVWITIRDGRGKVIPYRGYGADAVPAVANRDDFVVLRPGYTWGRVLPAEDFPIRLSQPGEYRASADFASLVTGTAFGMPVWSGDLASAPIRVRVVRPRGRPGGSGR